MNSAETIIIFGCGASAIAVRGAWKRIGLPVLLYRILEYPLFLERLCKRKPKCFGAQVVLVFVGFLLLLFVLFFV